MKGPSITKFFADDDLRRIMRAMGSKRTLTTIVAVVAGLAAYALVANYDKLLPVRWQTYQAPDGKYSIDMPGHPEAMTDQAPLPGGGTLTVYGVRTASRRTEYNCSYAEHENIGLKDPNQALEDTKNGTLGGLKGTLQNEHHLTVQNYPALEFQARTQQGMVTSSRLVLVGNRIYIMIALAESEKDRDPEAVNRVFNSLKILKTE